MSDRRGVDQIRVSVGLDRNNWAKSAEVFHKQITELGENYTELRTQCNLVLSENRQLKERLAAMESRQENIENMFLTRSIDLPKEKLVKLK